MRIPDEVVIAAKNADLDAVKAWLAEPSAYYGGAKIDATGGLFGCSGWTLLDLACLGDTATADHVALAEYLLSCGADVNQGDRSPLFAAVARQHKSQADMVGLLLRKGSEVDARNSESETPLSWAIKLGFGPRVETYTRALDCVVKLLRYGAALDAVGRLSSTNHDGELNSIEDYIARQLDWYPNLHSNEHFVACQAIIAGVRAVGSWRAFRDAPTNPWRAYERVPRKAVLRLRSLVARERATTADPVFKALFASPNEIVWHVLSFWDARIE